MTTITIYKCDKCGIEARSDSDIALCNSFKPIKIEFDLGSPYSYRNPSKYYLLCQECLAKVGVAKKETVEEMKEQEQSIQDRLYDIVAEIVESIAGREQ